MRPRAARAYSLDRHRVTTTLVRNAAVEVFGRRFTPHWLPWALTAGIAAVLIVATVALWNLQPWGTRPGAARVPRVTPPWRPPWQRPHRP